MCLFCDILKGTEFLCQITEAGQDVWVWGREWKEAFGFLVNTNAILLLHSEQRALLCVRPAQAVFPIPVAQDKPSFWATEDCQSWDFRYLQFPKFLKWFRNMHGLAPKSNLWDEPMHFWEIYFYCKHVAWTSRCWVLTAAIHFSKNISCLTWKFRTTSLQWGITWRAWIL